MSSVPNYRQEIRGILRDPGPGSSKNDPKSDNQKQQQQSNPEPKVLNRLSRVVHPQLHQQHLKNLWKHYLYELQQRAPTPKRVLCPFVIRSRPSYYGREFHGIMSRDEAEQILLEDGGIDGRYLIRESARQKSQITLSLRFQGQTKNFRLFYENQKHFVNDLKRFDTVHDLVADGLITLFVELNAADYIANLTTECRYEESPYMTFHKERLISQKNNMNSKLSIQNSNNRRSILLDGPGPTSGSSSSSAMVAAPSKIIKPISHEELICSGDDPVPGSTTTIMMDDKDLDQKFNVKLLEKCHNFKTHTFIGHPWCDFCGNFIWGLIGQGVRCDDCGFGAHRKCSELVPNDCCPDLRHIRRIFGIDLTTFCKASNSLRPFLVEQLIQEIERRGLRQEGLYRVCGSQDEIELLKNRFESEWEKIPKQLEQIDDIHCLTGLLKLYLRSLPIPLITFDSYQYFIDAAKKTSQEQSINGLREAACNRLPPAHYQTLKFLIIHLNKVCAYEDYNLMSAKNLSLIFGQTLIYTPNIPMLFQMNCWEFESKTIELMILFFNKIFIK